MNDIFMRTCRLKNNQRAMYSEYKNRHDFKYQVIVTLNDLIEHLSDSFNESTNDTVMIRESKLQK